MSIVVLDQGSTAGMDGPMRTRTVSSRLRWCKSRWSMAGWLMLGQADPILMMETDWRLDLRNRAAFRPTRRWGPLPRMEKQVLKDTRGFKFMGYRVLLGALKYRGMLQPMRRALWTRACD